MKWTMFWHGVFKHINNTPLLKSMLIITVWCDLTAAKHLFVPANDNRRHHD